MEIEEENHPGPIEQIINQFHETLLAGENQQALEYLLQALEKHPESDELLYELGFYYYEIGEMDLAQEKLTLSIQLNPDSNPEKYFTLANINQDPDSAKLYLYGIQLANTQIGSLNELEQKKLLRLVCQAYCSLY